MKKFLFFKNIKILHMKKSCISSLDPVVLLFSKGLTVYLMHGT